MKRVVVVLPTYNEKDNIEKIVNDVLSQQKNLPEYKIEVLIVDSGSPDGTLGIAKKLSSKNSGIHYIEVGRGLGVGLIKGHEYSLSHLHPDILAQLDADGQVSADVLVNLVGAINEGYTLAIGSRFVKGGKNQLSFARRLFSVGASTLCRILMGPISIREFTNSARAFTPGLFKKIKLERIPWRERTFIIQPAFLHEAILSGAKYKEVPLIFKDRLEGYSKNKVFNYTYDVIAYCIDARLNAWGFRINFFRMSRRIKTFVKFGLVGFVGTLVDFFFYKVFIRGFGIPPATSKGMSAEIAIINNFFLNNFWTFRYRKTKKNIWTKMGIFNLVSLGGLAMSVLIVKYLHTIYGDGFIYILDHPFAYNNFYFLATIPPVMTWNFLMNHFVTWRHQDD